MNSPLMHVGRYAGKPVDQLPVSYCRWILTQEFPVEITAAAEKKVRESSGTDNAHVGVSRHAIDRFSLDFLYLWLESSDRNENDIGLATYITQYAEDAWLRGKDVSKHRHQDDGIVKELGGMRWVFIQSPHFPEYKELITVYAIPNY